MSTEPADPWTGAISTTDTPPARVDINVPVETFIDRVNRYARLRREQTAREEQADAIKAEANKLEEQLLEEFSAGAVQNIKSADSGTVYLQRLLWAKLDEGVDKDAACDGLVKAGHPEFVSRGYNSQTVSGWLRERERNGEQVIPPELDGLLSTSEVFRLKVRKS